MRRTKRSKEDAELDVTSFMNLMIVLVPVLLLNMVFAQTVVLEIKLPAAANAAIENKQENKDIELIIREEYMLLNFPAGSPIKKFDVIDGQHDFRGLSDTLQLVKKKFVSESFKKSDILILSEVETSYQTIVSAMDTVRSYEDAYLGSVEEFELFPDVSLGDAPGGANAAVPDATAEGGAP